MEKLIEKLKLFSVCKESGCWNWKGVLDRRGYGRITYEGNSVGAHRLSWLVHYGILPKGKFVLHKCENRKCINPEHLYLAERRNYKTFKPRKTRVRKYAKRLSVDMPETVYQYLEEMRKSRNCTMAKLIRRIILERIKLEEMLK